MVKIHNIFKNLKKRPDSKYILSFLVITVIGLILRIYFIFNFDVFTDEVFYTGVARLNSFTNLFTQNFWIKDHGILYLLFLKVIQFFTTDIVFIRLPNLLIFLIINLSLFYFFKKIRNDITSLIPVALFSFLPYVVFINVYVSIYNFVILFSVLTFIFLSRFILLTGKNAWTNLFLFVVFLTLAFYSDYSSVYLYLSLIGILLFVFYYKKEKIIFIFTALLVNVVFILPGVGQFFNNFQSVSSLSSTCCLADTQFAVFLPNFLYAVFFRIDYIFSLALLISITAILLIIFFKSKNEITKYLVTYIGFGFLTSFIFLYFINRYFLPLLIDRTLFIFNFLIILSVYCIYLFTYKSKKINISFFLVLLIFIFWKLFQSTVMPGNFPETNIQYKNFVGELIKNKEIKKVDEIVFVDARKSYSYISLKDYYFLGLSSYMKNSIADDFNNKTYRVVNYYRLIKYHPNESYNQLFVIFPTIDFDFDNFKNEIISSNRMNLIRIFYTLDCSDGLNCTFKKLN